MSETKYTVVLMVETRYEVEAESPEAAATAVRDGDAGEGYVHDTTIEKVVFAGADAWFEADLREPISCRSCGTQLDPKYQLTECTDCYLERRRS